jgi:hypothetical protein
LKRHGYICTGAKHSTPSLAQNLASNFKLFSSYTHERERNIETEKKTKKEMEIEIEKESEKRGESER